jgi:hypothetical protein
MNKMKVSLSFSAVAYLAVSAPAATSAFNPSKDTSRTRQIIANPPTSNLISLNQSKKNEMNDELDDLSPPSITFTKFSILFGEDPPTQANNVPLLLWQETKTILPSFVTGAWDEKDGDRHPVEHLYNLVFVRLPVILMGAVYLNNLLHGHGLYMNFGHGNAPFEVPAAIVFGVIYVILR